MKSWLMPIVCAAALSLPLFSTTAEAGVAGKTYDSTLVSTFLDFIQDDMVFDGEDIVTVSDFTGVYDVRFDLDFVSLFDVTLVANEDDEFEVELIGLQIDTFVLGRGTDSDGAEWYFFGLEPEEEEPVEE